MINKITGKGQKCSRNHIIYKDQDLNISNQILSIDHKYAMGTTWADTDIGLQLQHTDFSDSFFAKLVDYPNYLFLYPEGGKLQIQQKRQTPVC